MGKSLSFGGVGASCTLDKVLKSVPLHGKAESLARRSRWQGGVAGKAESLARRSRWQGGVAGRAESLARRSRWQGGVASGGVYSFPSTHPGRGLKTQGIPK